MHLRDATKRISVLHTKLPGQGNPFATRQQTPHGLRSQGLSTMGAHLGNPRVKGCCYPAESLVAESGGNKARF